MSNTSFLIDGREVGRTKPPYIIAEIGSNFDQSLSVARQLIDECAEAGVDAVKFQLFQAENMYPESSELYGIFKSIELPPDWLPDLRSHATNRGVHFLASPFDCVCVDRLVDVGVPALKVASSETTKLGLVQYMASKGLPMLVSTGMCDLVDVSEAVTACERAGNRSIALLQCGARYPLPIAESNLAVMATFHNLFGCPVGFSDHTEGSTACITAVGLGASIIEKHVTLDRNSDGPDHFFAMETRELKGFVLALKDAHTAIGGGRKDMLDEERSVGRRDGLYAARALKTGDVLSIDDISIQRPAVGIRGRYCDAALGAIVNTNIADGEPIRWEDINIDPS